MTPYCPQARLDSGPYEVNFFAFGMLKYLLRRSGISWSGNDASSDSKVFTRKQKRRPPFPGGGAPEASGEAIRTSCGRRP